MPRLKHQWEQLPKIHKIAFTGEVLHIYGCIAKIMSKKRRCTIAGITLLVLFDFYEIDEDGHDDVLRWSKSDIKLGVCLDHDL